MSHRSLIVLLLLLAASAFWLESHGHSREDDTQPMKTATAPRVLPGMQADGFVQLPNQWRLRPAGSQLEIGDFPAAMALHPDGQYLAVLHCGYRDHEVMILDIRGARPRVVSRVSVDQAFYGLAFSPDGRRLFASGGEYEVVHEYSFRAGYLSNHVAIPIVDQKSKFVVGGVAITPNNKTLIACGVFGNALALVPLDDPEKKQLLALGPVGKQLAKEVLAPAFRDNERDAITIDTSTDSYPYAAIVEPSGRRAFVSLWNKAAVAVIDLAEQKVTAHLADGKAPDRDGPAPDGKTLFVACANSTKVSVLDTADRQGDWRRSPAPCTRRRPSGNTPNSLCLTPDGKMLFVANADANNLAVFNVAEPGKAKPLGFIPTGWYPTSVRFNRDRQAALRRQRQGACSSTPTRKARTRPSPAGQRLREYIAGLFRGTLSVIDLPDAGTDGATTASDAYACSPLQGRPAACPTPPPEGNPIPAKVGDAEPDQVRASTSSRRTAPTTRSSAT